MGGFHAKSLRRSSMIMYPRAHLLSVLAWRSLSSTSVSEWRNPTQKFVILKWTATRMILWQRWVMKLWALQPLENYSIICGQPQFILRDVRMMFCWKTMWTGLGLLFCKRKNMELTILHGIFPNECNLFKCFSAMFYPSNVLYNLIAVNVYDKYLHAHICNSCL